MPKNFDETDIKNLEAGLKLLIEDDSSDDSFIFYGRCSQKDEDTMTVKVMMGGDTGSATLLFLESLKKDPDILSVIQTALLIHLTEAKDEHKGKSKSRNN